MFRWLRIMCVLGVWAMLACAGAFAAASTFDVTLKVDGTTFGQAAGSVEVSPAANGRLTYTLSDGKFTPADIPGSTLVWKDEYLSGSGSVENAEKLTLKEFEVTVKQTSGVDISYRLRLCASMDDGRIKTITLEQVP